MDTREPEVGAVVGPAGSTEPSAAGWVEVGDVASAIRVIVARLEEVGWTRDELAARAGLNAASLRRLLTSPDANPTFATLTSLTEALGLRVGLAPADAGGDLVGT